LPDDVWTRILASVKPDDILSFGVCSHYTARLIENNPLVWIYSASRRWNFGNSSPVTDKESFKKIFRLDFGDSSAPPPVPLPLDTISCSCEEYSSGYGLANLTRKSTTCFCTKNTYKDVDIVLKLAEIKSVDNKDLVMFITAVDIRDPGFGFTAPVDTCVIYVFNEKPDLEILKKHNSMDENKYNELFSQISTCDR